ncbi:addiction module protein [Limnochorda pilosa]
MTEGVLTPPEVEGPASEKLQLVEDLWDDIASTPDVVSMPASRA